MPQQFNTSMPDPHEAFAQQISVDDSCSEANERQILLDYLLEEGFLWIEATKLIDLRVHLYENAEMRQRLANDYRLQFVRWLYEQGELHED